MDPVSGSNPYPEVWYGGLGDTVSGSSIEKPLSNNQSRLSFRFVSCVGDDQSTTFDDDDGGILSTTTDSFIVWPVTTGFIK